MLSFLYQNILRQKKTLLAGIVYILLTSTAFGLSVAQAGDSGAQADATTPAATEDPTEIPAENPTELRERKHSFIISPGVSFTDSKDSVVSRLFRFGIGGKLRLGYEFLDDSQYHLVHLSGGGGLLYSNFPSSLSSTANETQFFFNLLYASLFTVFKSPPFSLYLGGVLETNVDFWIPSFLNYGWSAHIAVGPALTGLFELGPHRIKGSFFLPMIGSQTRPRFNSYNYETEVLLEQYGFIAGGIRILAKDSSFAFWHNFFRASLLLDYSYTVTPFLDLNVAYNIEGEYRNLPESTQSKLFLQNSIFLGLAWRW